MADKSERPVYKVVVVGDSATGKTSFIKRLCLGHFTESYRATIGTDFAAKAMKIKEKELLLQLWDIAGQDRIRNVTHVFYRNAAAAIVMCDWANMSTLEGATVWKKDIADKVLLADGTPLPCFLLVNKVRLESIHLNFPFHHVVELTHAPSALTPERPARLNRPVRQGNR
eukprot:m.164796 g.164796  ORF g.164796 m.164796 type:complete len:170 (+) comp9888_c1_seq3:182-691(+)